MDALSGYATTDSDDNSNDNSNDSGVARAPLSKTVVSRPAPSSDKALTKRKALVPPRKKSKTGCFSGQLTAYSDDEDDEHPTGSPKSCNFGHLLPSPQLRKFRNRRQEDPGGNTFAALVQRNHDYTVTLRAAVETRTKNDEAKQDSVSQKLEHLYQSLQLESFSDSNMVMRKKQGQKTWAESLRGTHDFFNPNRGTPVKEPHGSNLSEVLWNPRGAFQRFEYEERLTVLEEQARVLAAAEEE